MTPEQRRTISLYRLECSTEALKEAHTLIKDGLLRGTANRIYYALFYSVSAYAFTQKFYTSKHTALQSWYNKNIVKTGLIDKELSRLYNLAMETRTRGDYKDLVKLDEYKIELMLLQAEPFINFMKELTIKRLNEESENPPK